MQFDQFSGQSFEQLIQALAAHFFGPGVTIFGPGRDGGREATFSGALPTFEAKGWDGYTVVQAKCKERPSGDARDAAWLCEQLKDELQKFVDNEQLERPEYYLLCTNVQLSAVPTIGGKQRVEDVFNAFAPALRLKGWHVWSADELRALLADAPSVRQTFASWITPGDILFELMEQLVGADLKSLLPLMLSRELRNDRDARLRDAGQETEQAVFLESVFIDLPVELPVEFKYAGLLEEVEAGGNNFDNVMQEIEEEEYVFGTIHTESNSDVSLAEQSDRCVSSIFTLAADKLDPKSVDKGRRNKLWALRNRVVILGGPGQGKSTLGQFVVQLARARLLAVSDRLTLNPETSAAIRQINEAAENLGIPLHGPARIPVRVDLPMFADAMNKGGVASESILSFVAARYSAISGSTVTLAAVRKLLTEFPWIVIFDGLDEVPPSANRQDVINSIETFWDDVYNVGADVLCVVTSRPQGYDNDLSPKLWQHWSLLPLTPPYAVEYATKLGNIRVSEPDRRATILEDIKDACSDPSTALLTTSPLQITILFGISFLKGSIPQDRWELFDRYYNLLRERESQKPGATSRFIRENKRTIDDLHQTCGWILQSEAEAPGRTVSFLTSAQFKDVIIKILEDEGHEEDSIDELTDRLAVIATDRLVLLTSRTEGQVSFDVRSLQEYMAAAKLVGADQNLIVLRLKKIAASAHWRHVFRIAASKIFSVAEMGHLRENIVAICDALDKGDLDRNGPFVGAGAALALDLLADGVASNTPKFHKILLARAVAALDMSPFDNRIAAVIDPEKSDVFFEELETRLNAGDLTSIRNSVASLMMVQNSNKAAKLLEKFFLKQPSWVLRVLSSLDLNFMSLPKKHRIRLRELQKLAGEVATCEFIATTETSDTADFRTEIAFPPELAYPSLPSHSVTIGLTGDIATKISPIDMILKLYREVNQDLDWKGWPIVSAAKLFAENPSPITLAQCATILGALEDAHLAAFDFDVPWPLRAIISDLREGQNCDRLAEAARTGQFGDHRAWLEAELRWRNTPLTAQDFLTWNSGYYLNPDIGKIGPPPINTILNSAREDHSSLEELLEISAALQDGPKRDLLLWLILSSLLRGRRVPNPDFIQKLLDVYFSSDQETVLLSNRRSRIFYLSGSIWGDKRVLALAHRYGISGHRIRADLGDLLQGFNSNPELRGLLAHVPISYNLKSEPLRLMVDKTALVAMDDDPAMVRAGIILLRLNLNEIQDMDFERASSELIASSASVISGAARLLKKLEPGDVTRQELGYQIAKQMRLSGKQISGRLLDLLKSNVSAAPTGLTSHPECDSLGLPSLVRL